MSCPNYDKNFQETLTNLLGTPPDTQTRTKLFVICVLFRLSLAYLVFSSTSSKLLLQLVLVASMFSIYTLSNALMYSDNKQWWSKKYQLIMSIIIASLCIYSLYTGKYMFKAVGSAMFISVLGGVLQRIQTTIC